MAYSRVVAIGDGSTTQFTVNFALDYLLESDVTCRVGDETDGSGDPLYRTITFLSTNLIQVGGTPAGTGVHVVFERTVDKESLRIDYHNGDELDEDNLMTAQKQAMMAVHEVLDGRLSVLTRDLDVGTFHVVNVADPVDAQDAATKNYGDTHWGGAAAELAVEQADIATAQAGIATTKAADATTQAAAALSSKNDAATSASTATTQAGIATAQAALALGYANDAANSASIVALPIDASAGAGGNDYTALQTAFDTVYAAGGGMVVLRRGKIYKSVHTGSTPNKGLVLWPGVILILNGATINFECTGDCFGIRKLGGIIGPGNLKTTVSASPGSANYWHAPVFIGHYYGEFPTVASSAGSLFLAPSNWSIRNVTLDCVRNDASVPGGSIIAISGGAHHGLIHDITIPDNSTIALGIAADWAIVGPVDSNNVPATAALYPASAYTTHPHDVDIQRINIGNLSRANTGSFGSHGIRLSGVYDFYIDGVTVKGSTFAGFFNTVGDLGFEFSPTTVERDKRAKGIVVRNYTIDNANNGWGVYCDFFADNVKAAVDLGYSNSLPTIYETDIVFENVFTLGSTSSSAWPGFRMQNMIGGRMVNCRARRHGVGILIETGCDKLEIYGGVYDSNWTHGIVLQGSDVPEDILIERSRAFSNGIGGGTTDAGISITAGMRPVVRLCLLGAGSDGFQDRGISVGNSLTSLQAVFEENYVYSVQSGGTAYWMGSSGDYGMLALYSNNRCASAITNKYAGVNIQPIRKDINPDNSVNTVYKASRFVLTSDITPPSGFVSAAGDTIFYSNPSASQYMGSFCSTGGVVGSGAVWKSMGTTGA